MNIYIDIYNTYLYCVRHQKDIVPFGYLYIFIDIYQGASSQMGGEPAACTGMRKCRPVPVAPSGRGPRDGDAVRPVPPPALAALAHRVPGGEPGLAVGTRGHIPVPRGLGGRW